MGGGREKGIRTVVIYKGFDVAKNFRVALVGDLGHGF